MAQTLALSKVATLILLLLVISWTLWTFGMDTWPFVKDLGPASPADFPTAKVSKTIVSNAVTSHHLEMSNAALMSPIPASTSSSPLASSTPANASLKSERPLILYAYFETDEARFNLEFFVKHALHAQADFVFILSGDNEAEKIIPEEPNIRHIKRQNMCYDLGAYAETLLKDDLYKRYKKFILINASLRGPFIPYWSEACWSELYLNKITDEIKLVGMTANCWPQMHVQSMILATDDIGMEVLLFPPADAVEEMKKIPEYAGRQRKAWPPYPGINYCFPSKIAAVRAEVGSSVLMTTVGYKLDAMMAAYHTGCFEECISGAELLNENTYFGISYHPYETVFFKTNRPINQKVIDRYTEWTEARNYSSYEFCKAPV